MYYKTHIFGEYFVVFGGINKINGYTSFACWYLYQTGRVCFHVEKSISYLEVLL